MDGGNLTFYFLFNSNSTELTLLRYMFLLEIEAEVESLEYFLCLAMLDRVCIRMIWVAWGLDWIG